MHQELFEVIEATKLARPALAKSLRGWAVLPNPFVTARGSAARARWLTRTGKKTSATGAITPYSYEAASHRLTNTGTEARTYDAVGNPRTIGPRTLTYDDRSRLTVFVNGSTTRRYQYTGQGLRVRKWTSSNTSGNSYFVYNENAQLVGEYDNAGSRVQEIVWLGNLPIGVIAGTTATPVLHYIESDHLGTPRVIVDPTRNVGIWRWNQTNDPFGESSPNQNPDGDATSVTFNLRFAGQYRDAESGYFYNVNRFFDPSTGRYLESDPIGLNGGISTYSYVGAAPLTAVDPLGLEKLILLGPAFWNYGSPSGLDQRRADEQIRIQRANDYIDVPGVWSVFAHGNSNRVYDTSGDVFRSMKPEDFAKMLIDRGWKEGQQIRLYSCRAGEGENSFAEQLARILKTEVLAPNTYAWYNHAPDSSGPTWFFGKDASGAMDRSQQGQMISFNKQNKSCECEP